VSTSFHHVTIASASLAAPASSSTRVMTVASTSSTRVMTVASTLSSASRAAPASSSTRVMTVASTLSSASPAAPAPCVSHGIISSSTQTCITTDNRGSQTNAYKSKLVVYRRPGFSPASINNNKSPRLPINLGRSPKFFTPVERRTFALNKSPMISSSPSRQHVTFVATLLLSDSDVLFYTGIATRSLFHALHDLVGSFVRHRSHVTFSFVKSMRKYLPSPIRFGPNRKLSSIDEFLLVCMKLKMGLLSSDLARRFSISETLCSAIIHKWVNVMHKTIGKYVYWASREEVKASKPMRYRDFPDLRAIIDCTEIFIETPKDPLLQYNTWSNYKHHNTVKFLIAVAPNSSITYVSPVYTGRNSDTAITKHCGFLDKLDLHDHIMADKGFLINEECAHRLITVDIPPGKRGVSQMSAAMIAKTKRIANKRILVEQVIGRLKTFRILSHEMPLSLLPLASKIVVICSALCNLKGPIYKT
jgi:hypothetical protein